MNRLQHQYNKIALRIIIGVYLVITLIASPLRAADETVTVSFHNTELREAMQMLSLQHRVNILIADNVTGNVSANLYDVTLDTAIRAIVESVGLAMEFRDGNYYILEHTDVGLYEANGITELRTYKIQYTTPSLVEDILVKHLSNHGEITNLDDRKILVIEDLPAVLDKIEVLLAEIDREPKQIFIEAKILEVTLLDDESFGLDWTRLFTRGDNTGSFGTQGLGNPSSPGFFFDLVSPNVEVVLNALKKRGRLRTLSTPKLLTMENREAETMIGKNIGYQVTVTTNDVTTTSIEYLNTGIILKVTPSVDNKGRILLDIHPEVSDGTVDSAGVPSKTTTQVNSQMLVPDGQTVFIGGLIKHQVNETRESVPILGDMPLIGTLFSSKSDNLLNTETLVLITPSIVDHENDPIGVSEIERTNKISQNLSNRVTRAESKMEGIFDGSTGSKTVGTSSDLISSNVQNSYMILTRFAAQQLYAPANLLKDSYGIERTSVTRDSINLIPDAAIYAEPLRAWQAGEYYLTAVKLTNRSEQSQLLDPRDLRGSWLAATFQHQKLSEAGNDADTTVVYLISGRPFEASL